jgi:hypothetical protein
MCSDAMHATDVAEGAGYANGDWIGLDRAVVSLEHSRFVTGDHALSIDFRSGDPSQRVAVELDAESARDLAYSIIATLQQG